MRDEDGAKAAAALDRAHAAFRRHTAANARLAAMAAASADAAGSATAIVRSRTWLPLASVAAVLGAALALAYWVVRAVLGAVAALRRESDAIVAAVEDGRLDARTSADGVAAEFVPVLAGLDATMDAFTRPLRRSAACSTRSHRRTGRPPAHPGGAHGSRSCRTYATALRTSRGVRGTWAW